MEAFALFNVFYQVGSLVGPLLGMALIAIDFSLVATVAATLFAVLTILQALALPSLEHNAQGPTSARGQSVRAGVRAVFSNTRFIVISVAMAGSYILSFQVYLAIPLATQGGVVESGLSLEQGRYAVAALFLVSALVAIVGQVRLTSWAKKRWGPSQALPLGVFLMASAFLPMLASSMMIELARDTESAIMALALVTTPGVLTVTLLGLGTMLAYPFEMDTVVRLSGQRSVALHYGLYNTVSGIAITVGNLLVGAGLESRFSQSGNTVWLALIAVGVVCSVCTGLIGRAGWYSTHAAQEPVVNRQHG